MSEQDVNVIDRSFSRTIRVNCQDNMDYAAGDVAAELSMADDRVVVIIEHESLKERILSSLSKLADRLPHLAGLDIFIVWQLKQSEKPLDLTTKINVVPGPQNPPRPKIRQEFA